ncbi:MAG: NAD(P)/FAD-dependent oxidoreductase [Bacteroidetes bacterium]|nr:NAD(P)/FAD-dependent oxidoreductase [Bacteroidota bacterium]MCB0854354.1 NAD(P)/FAD-dependent oxidoreductase [Bacteroidota bacterium]
MNNSPLFDVIIIGAGLSGIGAAYHIQNDCPDHSFAILEGRGSMGGTWDLFRYPGIRSDSDMYTLGFSFYPWKNPKAIADGPAILSYIKETSRHFGIDQHIRFHHRVISADWSDKDQIWTLEIASHPEVENQVFQCRFLFACSGYYSYEAGYEPVFPGRDSFEGKVIHPQKWDTNLDYANQKIVVIGSGATAVTLVPELAKVAEEVVMLQRTPTYIVNLPSEDVLGNFLKKILPIKLAHKIIRWKNILFSMGFYQAAQKWPKTIRRYIQKKIQEELGSVYQEKDFDPPYNPWDQRLCLVPDGDFFHALAAGKARIVTDTIERFTSKGILLQSGNELSADIIITATGLQIQMLGGMEVSRNEEPVEIKDIHCYKGVMFSEIPNFALALGYTNASWTLKCDLNCKFVTRVLNYMKKHDYQTCTPRFDPQRFDSEPLLNLSSGYVQRALDELPKQGSAAPWKVYQNYFKDLLALKWSGVDDKYLIFFSKHKSPNHK